MNLHRAGAVPDWHDVTPGRRNVWQHLAARTYGIATPANVVSLLGFLSVPAAIIGIDRYHGYIAAAGLLFAGRCLDIVDGWLAERTGTKSPLGEVLDASLDKVATVLMLAAVVIFGLMPAVVIFLLLVMQSIIAGLSLYGLISRQKLHPSRNGKLGMAAAWLCMLVFITLAGLQSGNLRTYTYTAAYVLFCAALVLGILTIRDYAGEVLGR